MLIEQWILDYALRNNCVQVARALEGVSPKKGGDANWLIAALRIIVFDRQFPQFLVAHRIVELLTQAVPNVLIEEDEVFQLKFYLNLMSVLGSVGHTSATDVVQLLRRTFDSVDDDGVNELRTDITKRTFKAVRCYVLRLLLKDTRQRHFAARKFPDSFADVLATLDAITTKLIENAWQQLPPSKLEMLASGVSVAEVVDEAEDANDPGVALFVEVFGERLPSESELIAFLQQIKDSQLTLTPPDLFAPFSRPYASTSAPPITASAPNVIYGSNATPIDGSDEMFSSPTPCPAQNSSNVPAVTDSSIITRDCIVSIVPLELTVLRRYLM